MALSQEQKKFLNELTFNPEACLKHFQEHPNYVKKFEGQFLVDGTSLLHVLMEGFLTENQAIYEQIIEFVMKHSNMSFFDRKDSQKQTAFGIFEEHYKHYSLDTTRMIQQGHKPVDDNTFFSRFLKLGLLSKGKISEYQYIKMAAYLILNEQIDTYRTFCEIDTFEHKHSTFLLQSMIMTDHVELLKEFINSHKAVKEDIIYDSIRHPHEPDNVSNLLVFAAYQQAHQVFEYLFNEFDFDLSGKIAQRDKFPNIYVTNYLVKGSKPKRYTSPLNELIFSGDIKNFELLFQHLELKDILMHLKRRENVIGGKVSNGLALGYEMILDNKNPVFFKHLLEKTQNINQLEFKEKSDYITELLSLNLSDERLIKIHALVKQIDWKQLNQELTTGRDFTDKFIRRIAGAQLNEQSFNLIREILSDIFSLDKINTLSVFNEQSIKRPDLIKMIQDILPIEKIGNYHHYEHDFIQVNPFNYILKQYTNLIRFPQEYEKAIKQSMTLLYQKHHHHLELGLENTTENIFNFIIKNGISLVMDIMDDNLLLEKNMVSDNLFNQILNNAEFYPLAVKKLLSLGANPFKEGSTKIFNQDYAGYPFFDFMSHQLPHDLLLQTVHQFNKNFHDLSQYPDFWDNLRHADDEMFSFIYEQGADFNNIEQLTRMSYFDSNYIGKYLKYSTLNLPSGAIHQMIKNKHYEGAMAAMQSRPILAVEANEQKRFPAFYLISFLHQELKDRSLSPSGQNCVNLLLLNIQLAAQQKKPKVIESMLKQLNKYPVIFDKLPDLQTSINYHFLQSKTKNVEIKRKMKI